MEIAHPRATPHRRREVGVFFLTFAVFISLLVTGFGAEIHVTGNLAFLGDAQGKLALFDVSDSSNPALVSISLEPGSVEGVFVDGQYAFVAAAELGLLIIDVSDPATPIAVGRYDTDGSSVDVQLADGTAFVADEGRGVMIVDVNEPARPLGLATLAELDNVLGVDLFNPLLYVASGAAGLKIYWVADPSNPIYFGGLATTGVARRVHVGGSLAYVVCGDSRIEFVDVSNPVSPVLAGSHSTVGKVADMDVKGAFVFLANTNGTLEVIDVSEPTNPVVQGTYSIPGGALGVHVVGKHAYIRDAAGSVVVVELTEFAPIAPRLAGPLEEVIGLRGRDAVLSVQVEGTPPLSYQWLKNGAPITPDGRITGVVGPHLKLRTLVGADAGEYSVMVSNAFGVVVSSNSRLSVVELGTPLLKGVFSTDGLTLGIEAVGSTVYAAAGDLGLEIFDATNPRWPVRLGGFDTEGLAQGVEVVGNYAFVADGAAGLQVIDVANSYGPDRVGTFNTAGTAYGIDVVGGIVYVADGESGLEIIDSNDPGQPVRVGGYDTPGTAYEVEAAGGLVYVADGIAGIHIINVTNSATPLRVGGYDTLGDARGVKVVGSTAYVADGSGGLLVLDVSDPANPIHIGNHSAAGPVTDLAVFGGMALLAEGTNGVELVNVANPTNIMQIGINTTVGNATGLSLAGTTVYVAASENGVRILELAGLAATWPEIQSPPGDAVRLPTQSVTLHVAANGTAPLRFQWFRNGQVLFESVRVKGVATDTLQLSNLQYDDSATYSVAVWNAWNLGNSAAATLRVVPLGTPVFVSANFDTNDVLSAHVVGQLAFVANRIRGLQVVDCRDPLVPVLVGGHATSGFAQDVQVRGHLAYVAAWDAGVEIFDVLDPTNIVRIGHSDTPGFACGIHVSGARAYIADHHAGLQVIDVSDPTRPLLLGNAATSGFALDVQVAGNSAYVAVSGAGLEIFNVSDPFGIVRLGSVDTPGEAKRLELVGNLAYVADYDAGLQIIDISNPATPLKLGGFDTRGDAFDVRVVGSLAYVAEGISGIEVLDVSDLGQPSLALVGIVGDSVHSLQVAGKHAFLADRVTGFVISELLGRAPVAPRVVELSESMTAVAGRDFVISVATEGTPPLTFQWYKDGVTLTQDGRVNGVNEPHLQVHNLAASDAGHYRVAVSSPYGEVTSSDVAVTVLALGTPVVKGNIETPGEALSGTILGNLAFIADGSAGMRIIDVADPASPKELAAYSAPGITYGVWVQSNRVYLARGVAGVKILDLSNPSKPALIGGYDTPGTALAVCVVEGLAYVADGINGVQILNVADPANATLVGGFDTAGSAYDVQVIGNFAYVADGSAGVQIINVANPANPVQIGAFDTPGTAYAVQVKGSLVYVADGQQGLAIIDVRDPASPSLLGSYVTGGLAKDLDVAENLVTLADGSAGFAVLNATDPRNVVLVGSDRGAADVSGVTVAGSMVYIARGSAGLQIMELTGLLPTVPAILAQPTGQTVQYGAAAEFHAISFGSTPLNFRWYHDGRPLTDDAHITGAARSNLRIANVQRQHAGRYALRVWNDAGVTQSQPASLAFVGLLQSQINAASPGSAIDVPAGVYEETLTLDKNLTLTGAGTGNTILDGLGLGTIVHVGNGANVTLRGMTLRNGNAADDHGGAIKNEGELILDDCILTGSSATRGGGVANLKFAKILSSIISNNLSAGLGGGVYNGPGATMEITDATVSGNTAGNGGGIHTSGSLVLANCTVSGNLAGGAFETSDGNGGGIHGTSGSSQLVNCTVSGNTAFAFTLSPGGGAGGGIFAEGGSLEMRASTLCFNTASKQGGGVLAGSNSTLRARNTIVADNRAFGADADFDGTLNSDGYNLLQSTAGLHIVGNTSGNLLGVDPLLGPLKNNGGITATHTLQRGSPAIDAGACDNPAVDQRGVARPFDMPLAANTAGGCDIGAFEYVNLPPQLTLPSDPVMDQNGPPLIIPLLVVDAETSGGLQITIASSNEDLIPSGNVVLSGSPPEFALTITPAANHSGTARIQVSATDLDGTTQSGFFDLVVWTVNTAPTVAAIDNAEVNEGVLLTFAAVAADVDVPTNRLTFSLGSGAPAGANINPTNGVFRWTPTEAQGPGSYLVALIVIDDGSPSLSATQTFVVAITEVNTAPQLNPPADQIAYEGENISATATATDADVPANSLMFSLDPGAPPGARVNATSGLFTWTPTSGDVGTTPLTLRVIDDGSPALDSTRNFAITVVTRPTIETITVTNGTVILVWHAIPGRNYRVQFRTSMADAGWNDLPGVVTATSSLASKTDTPLATSRFYRVLALPAGQPVIRAITVTDGTIVLSWHAISGGNYRVQFKTSLADADWSDLPGDVTAAGSIASKTDAQFATNRFYRVVALAAGQPAQQLSAFPTALKRGY